MYFSGLLSQHMIMQTGGLHDLFKPMSYKHNNVQNLVSFHKGHILPFFLPFYYQQIWKKENDGEVICTKIQPLQDLGSRQCKITCQREKRSRSPGMRKETTRKMRSYRDIIKMIHNAKEKNICMISLALMAKGKVNKLLRNKVSSQS